LLDDFNFDLPYLLDCKNVKGIVSPIGTVDSLSAEQGAIGETFNIGGHNEWANIAIVKLVCELLNEPYSNSLEWAIKYPGAISALAHKSTELTTFVTEQGTIDFMPVIQPKQTTSWVIYLLSRLKRVSVKRLNGI
jgi:dTDP-D-glucose 4,6-dehydratase